MPARKTDKQIGYALITKGSLVLHTLNVFHLYRTKKAAVSAKRWNESKDSPLEVMKVEFIIKTYEA